MKEESAADELRTTQSHLRSDADAASRDQAVEDILPPRVWPIPLDASLEDIPPVGMSWRVVAEKLGIDVGILLHEGSIVVSGEYFPESGVAIDPADMKSQVVDVGQMALRPAYFIGQLTASEFGLKLPAGGFGSISHPVVKREQGSIIGLFSRRACAERARSRILQGSLGTGIAITSSALGFELTVERPGSMGRVATAVVSSRGALIAIGGNALSPPADTQLPLATGALPGSGDARRGGIGAFSGSPGPEVLQPQGHV